MIFDLPFKVSSANEDDQKSKFKTQQFRMGPMTTEENKGKTSRRNFLKFAASTAAFGPFFSFRARAFSGQQSLKIAKWAHFLPEFDTWFHSMAKEWGKQNDTDVALDLVPIEEIRAHALAEVAAGKGHDIFMFPWPPAEFHQHVIDHAGIYQGVAPKFGAVQQLAFRSTLIPKTKKYFAFADFWMPTPVNFFEDYLAQVGLPLGPVHYGSLLSGCKNMREKLGIPCGLAFSPTLEGNVTLHTILYSRRAFILDEKGDMVFNKNVFATQSLEYAQALCQQAGTPEQLTWGSGGNVRAMLGRKTSVTFNAISLLRTAEKHDPDVAKNIMLQPPLIGVSGMGVTALPHVTNCSAVWSFSQNQAGASKFLVDMVDNSRTGYEKSQGCNFPIYPKAVPDLVVRLEKDPKANPGYKYLALKDALHWTPNLGVPGFATPAFMEVFTTSLIPKALARIVKGEQTGQEAAASAAAEIQKIVDKWNQVS